MGGDNATDDADAAEERGLSAASVGSDDAADDAHPDDADDAEEIDMESPPHHGMNLANQPRYRRFGGQHNGPKALRRRQAAWDSCRSLQVAAHDPARDECPIRTNQPSCRRFAGQHDGPEALRRRQAAWDSCRSLQVAAHDPAQVPPFEAGFEVAQASVRERESE